MNPRCTNLASWIGPRLAYLTRPSIRANGVLRAERFYRSPHALVTAVGDGASIPNSMPACSHVLPKTTAHAASSFSAGNGAERCRAHLSAQGPDRSRVFLQRRLPNPFQTRESNAREQVKVARFVAGDRNNPLRA